MDSKDIKDALGYVMQGQREKSSPTSKNRGVGQSISVDQLYLLIDEQKQQIANLSQRVNQLETAIINQITSSSDTLLNRIEEMSSYFQSMRPENTYRAMLEFLQKLNKYIDDEKIDRDFAENIREYISSVLNTYGYRIVDYAPEIAYAYEEEYCSVEFPELVRRAIIDNKGNVVLKGKIYLSNNGQ